MATDNVFKTLNAIDVSGKVKQKNNLSYLSWASAVAEVKKLYPETVITIYPQNMDDKGNTRFWHDDGKTGWVEVGVTINGKEEKEVLAIMDFKNKAIAAENITSVDANKALKRCIVKAIALHGLGLFIYEGEDIPEDVAKATVLQNEIMALMKKKCDLGKEASEKVGKIAKEAEKEFDPSLEDDMITGNPRNIDDIEILEKLKKKLLAIRK